jgi:hypothetical protein
MYPVWTWAHNGPRCPFRHRTQKATHCSCPFLLSQLGLRVGSRLSEKFREGAERVAGIALLGLAAFLLVEHLASHRLRSQRASQKRNDGVYTLGQLSGVRAD